MCSSLVNRTFGTFQEKQPMSRIALPSPETTPAASVPLLEKVREQLGVVPNLFRLVAISPAGLEGFLGLFAALGQGSLDPKTRTRIALAVAGVNHCNYCASAHTYLARHVAKLDELEIEANRAGHSLDEKAAAAVVFARRIAETRGHVTKVEFDAVRQAGYSDPDIIEIILHVALNTLTNYVNETVLTDIDFPLVETARAAA